MRVGPEMHLCGQTGIPRVPGAKAAPSFGDLLQTNGFAYDEIDIRRRVILG